MAFTQTDLDALAQDALGPSSVKAFGREEIARPVDDLLKVMGVVGSQIAATNAAAAGLKPVTRINFIFREGEEC